MRYLIIDSYGTEQRTWTLKNAMCWLACCSPDAQVLCFWTGRVLYQRSQSRAY